MTTPRRVCAGILAAGLMLGVLGVSAGTALSESAPPAAEEKAAAAPVPAAAAKEQAPAPAAKSPPPAEPPKSGEPAPAARKPRPPLTEEEVKQLPPLTRFNIPLEKGEELLKDVKDDTFGYDESAFYYMVDKVLKDPPGFFKPDATVTAYKALLAMPSSYRGQPVTIRGVYMTAYPFSPPPLAIWKDVHTLYECSIREHPLNEHRPIATVIVIDDPMSYLRAGDDVQVKGYFYKTRKYEFRRQDENGNTITGTTVAPLLVARRLEPEEPTSPLSRLGAGPSILGGDWTGAGLMVVLVFVLGAAFIYLLMRTRGKTHAAVQRPVHRFRLRRPDRVEPPAASGPGNPGDSPKP